MRGRPAKPTALKVVQGNPGKRPLNKNEPKPRVVCPPAPTFMDATAKKEWRRIAKVLAAAKVLTEADLTGLQMYCVEYSRWREAVEALNGPEDIIATTPNGHHMPSIYRQIERGAFENLCKIMVQFGLTPAARTRVAAVEAEKKDTGFGHL